MFRLLDLLGELHECADESALRQRLTERVDRLVPCDLVSLNYIDLDGSHGGSVTSFNAGFKAGSELNQAFDLFADQHPLVKEMVRTGSAEPRRMSDYISAPAFRRLDLYHQVFRPLESLHQIGFSVGISPGLVVGIGLNRARRDFTDTQLQLVRLLHRHLAAAFSHVALKEAAAPRLDGYDLTDRQRELWVLLGQGLSNPEIAQRLFISRRTVEKHLEGLYVKLGVNSRWAAGALARSRNFR